MYKQESEEQKKFMQRLKARKRLIAVLRILLLIFIFACWEAVTWFNFLDRFIFSSPGRMLNTFIALQGRLIVYSCPYHVMGNSGWVFTGDHFRDPYCNCSLAIRNLLEGFGTVPCGSQCPS